MLGYIVGDSALYTQTTLQVFKREQSLFAARVPMQIKEAKELISEAPYAKIVEIVEGYRAFKTASCYAGVELKMDSHPQPSGLSKGMPYFSQALP
jgi:transposase